MPPLSKPSAEWYASEEGQAVVAHWDAVIARHKPAMDAVIAQAAAYRKDTQAILDSITDKALRDSLIAMGGIFVPRSIVLPIPGVR